MPQDLRGKGKQFSKDYQPKNRGRKPELYTIAHDCYNIGRVEFDRVSKYLLQLSVVELQALCKDTTQPAWVVVVASAIIADMKRGLTTTLSSLLDRVFGKASQPVTLDATTRATLENPTIDVAKLSDETLRELAAAQKTEASDE